MKHQDTVPFPDELEHLDHTLKIIDTALKKAGEDVLRLDQAYRDAKRYMAEYRNEMDRHEILQNEWALNQTDRTGAFAVEVREKLEKLKDTPYFARIDFVPDGEEEADTYYIGRFGFTHCNEKLIFDWRAPVSGIFYDYETSRAGFEAPVGRIEGELTRKRQFKIQNGTMEYAIESSANVQDEILQKELAHTSDEKMKSMISTIQREQNVIIRNERANTLIIQGVAGSGKTSIALHRIAFLLYRFKHQITAEDVMILSPNQVFADYISGVIPELGEEPVCERSLPDIAGDVREFLCSLMGKWEEVPKANVILKSLNKRLMIRDMLALYQDFYQYTDKKDMFVLSEENTLEWEDVFPFLYLMAAYEGIEENRSVKHLVIDEMQDYTPIQFAVLNMMYPCQKTILGDFGQILNPCHLHSLDEIRRIYKDAEFVALNKSYRSTYEIMEYAKKVCAQPSLEMVERHGERPGSIYCENVDH